MKFQVSENSLFALLLRSPWWISFALAAAMALLGWTLVPEAYRIPGALSCFPFVLIGVMAAWRQRNAPSTARVAQTAEAVGTMTWPVFAALLEQAFQRDHYAVQRRSGAADFELEQQGRRTLVSARRWKSARTGLEPLRELQAARVADDVTDAICVSLGAVSDQAAAFATQHRITIWQAAELAQALRGLALGPKA